MDPREVSTAEREAFPYWRFPHPHPRVQRKLEVRYLKRQGVSAAEVCRLCALARSPYARYLRAYRSGGIANLQEGPGARRHRELADYQVLIAEAFRQRPPASIAEAAQRIEQLTGLQRGPPQVRQFLKSLGMKPRKVGHLPAKAEVEAHEALKTPALEPRVAEAPAGQRRVCFMDAAHFVFAPFLGVVGGFARLFVKAPRGRQRVNVLAALDATPHELFPVTNLTYITSVTVWELRRLLASAPPGVPLTIVLDNARSQRCPLVQTLARSLAIELLFLPPYSPNLNLSERFWKFVKKQCLYSNYSANPHAFEQAIRTCIAPAPPLHRAALASLLTLKVQTFTAVPVLGAESTVHLFPVAKKAHPQGSSQAA